MVLLLLPLPWTEGWEMRRKIQGYGGEEERNGLPNVTTPCALTASFHWSSHTHQTLMWAMKGGNWWWLGFGSMWGGTWKLRGTGGCRCHGSWEGDRVQKHGEGDGDNPQRPWWRLQDHKILEVGSVALMKAPGPQDIRSRVCGMSTTQGRSWMKLRMKVPPRTEGEYSPHHCQCAQSRMLTQPTGAKKLKKKKKVMQTAMR